MCTVKTDDNSLLKVLQIFEKIHFEYEKTCIKKDIIIFQPFFFDLWLTLKIRDCSVYNRRDKMQHGS